MLFPTVRFAIFFAIVLPTSWLLLPRPVRWRLFIITASFVFYAAWDLHYAVLLAGSIIANQVFAVAIFHGLSDRDRKLRTAIAVAANLGVLGWFKYSGFIASSATGMLGWVGIRWSIPVPNVLLPIGISFFTFQALSYVIDVSRGDYRPATFLDFAAYLSFFPHLVAGPIVRANELIPQFRHRPDPRRVDATRAFWLIASGIFKKVVIASYLATAAADPLFAFPYQHGGIEALVGVYAYALQIYADFSGYTDIAIGLALLMGFRFPQNFNGPYTACSLQDFWRRWHITLSRWLRDYVYIPLGGNRQGRRRAYRNVLITMLLGGLWHGAAWTFVFWGALHGVGLVFERMWWPDGPPGPEARGVWLRRLVTFNFVCLAWIFFRAPTLSDAFTVINRIFLHTGSVPLNPMVVLVVAAMLVSQFVPARAIGRVQATVSRWSAAAQVGALATVLIAVDVLGPIGVAPFIYFQF